MCHVCCQSNLLTELSFNFKGGVGMKVGGGGIVILQKSANNFNGKDYIVLFIQKKYLLVFYILENISNRRNKWIREFFPGPTLNLMMVPNWSLWYVSRTLVANMPVQCILTHVYLFGMSLVSL